MFTWHGVLHYIHSNLQPLLCCKHSIVPLVGQVKTPGQGFRAWIWTDLDADRQTVVSSKMFLVSWDQQTNVLKDLSMCQAKADPSQQHKAEEAVVNTITNVIWAI